MLPVLAGDKLLVSTTLVVHAIDARSGEIAWQAGPPDGWEELAAPIRESLFKGIAERILVAPAVGGSIVVVDLQIPWAADPAEEWKGIHIKLSIPERRLLAFDLSSGKELWNHAPPLDWGGKSDDFAERMAVAGPPTVAGARVLVPCVPNYAVTTGSDIAYHVACYALDTGAFLWSTQVARGQREHTMHGKLREEFCGPPLVVDGDLVIAQTELGCVAALDLVAGSLLWRSEYPKIELPKVRTYSVPKAVNAWRMCAPVISAGVVISAPSDSLQILGFDRKHGRSLWGHELSELDAADPDTEQFGFDRLLGAAEEVLYLAGEKISALEKPDGLRSVAPFEPVWTFPIRERCRPPRPCLTADSVFFAFENACHVLNRLEGWTNPSIQVRHEGNVLVTEDALFVLSSDWLSRIPR